MSVNKVILIGNVGKDPEVQYVQENVPVAKFSLATSETYKNKEGVKVTNTEWHNIVVWRGLAKVVEQYVKKGAKLYIEGKITNRQYEKDGVTKYFTEIIARELTMLDRVQGESSDNHSTPAPQNETPDYSKDFSENAEADDDLPF
jgi:single-strand DNA-binding protein